MSDPFNPFEFAAFLRARWRLFAITCGVAVALSALASLLLPKRYTATATVLISPPAGNDPRATTVLSPIYLESLRTYERIASTDTLFLRALDHFHLQPAYAGTPVESLKRRILKVTKPVNTEILEISATLGDPRAAQAFAQFIAEQTCAASHSFDLASEDELTREARRNLDRAQTRFANAESARNAFAGAEAVGTLEEKVLNASELRTRIEDDLTGARTALADGIAARNAAASSGDQGWEAREVAAAQAKLKSLEDQDRAATAQLEAEGAVLEKRKSDGEALESELIAARAEIESATSKLNDIAVSSAFRGERLQIIDPGIVPQQPSSPNLWLNIAAALLVSLMAAFVFAALQFSRLHAMRTEQEYSFR
jgi:polysaccharide biosynthesis transport protein